MNTAFKPTAVSNNKPATSKRMDVQIIVNAETSNRDGSWAYKVSAVMADGSIGSREMFGAESATTHNRLSLTAAIEAVKSLRCPCNIEMYSNSKYFTDNINNGYVKTWVNNGWKSAAGATPKNIGQWMDFVSACKEGKHGLHVHYMKNGRVAEDDDE